MIQNVCTLKDPAGLHARLAAKIAEAARGYKSSLSIQFKGVEAKATDILGLMQIDANENDLLLVAADGPDEAHALSKVQGIIEAAS